MKRLIIIALLTVLSINAFGQAYTNDGIIEKIEIDNNGVYHLTMNGMINRTLDNVEIKDGKVARMYYRFRDLPERYKYTTLSKLRPLREIIIEYFEFEKGMRNLAPNNATTNVYRTKFYEYRISNTGVIIDLIL